MGHFMSSLHVVTSTNLFAYRVERQRRLMDTQPELTIRTATEHERLINHHFFTLAVRKVEIPHRDSEIAVDLDAVLGCIVIVTDLNPSVP